MCYFSSALEVRPSVRPAPAEDKDYVRAAAAKEEEEGPVSTWGKREKEKVDTARRGGACLLGRRRMER